MTRTATAMARTAIKTTIVDSPIGPLTLASEGGFLTRLVMEDQRHAPSGTEEWERDDAVFGAVIEQLEAYFNGDLLAFDLPVRLAGTEFQQRVWSGLQEIPFGVTMSYGELAAKVGNAKACRAVGLANGRNPVAIVVPCHRVIGANGTLTGYGGGLDRKQWLLDHESKHQR
jgi:methylated-DNA-[protein]-cysteine S-methyltransferase